jgi:hypothetical protein
MKTIMFGVAALLVAATTTASAQPPSQGGPNGTTTVRRTNEPTTKKASPKTKLAKKSLPVTKGPAPLRLDFLGTLGTGVATVGRGLGQDIGQAGQAIGQALTPDPNLTPTDGIAFSFLRKVRSPTKK